MFDEENLISLTIFLSFCPSTYVHPNPASHELANYKKESFKWTIFFREIFVFFLHNFRFLYEIFASFFSHYFAKFRISYFAKISLFLAKQIKAKFREKNEHFPIFGERTKCENEAKWSRTKNFRGKCEIFAKRFFSVRWKP